MTVATLKQKAARWGRELGQAGVNLDLAPVADVVPPGTDASNAPIGQLQREYGHDPADRREPRQRLHRRHDAGRHRHVGEAFPGPRSGRRQHGFHRRRRRRRSPARRPVPPALRRGGQGRRPVRDGLARHLHQDRPGPPRGLLADGHRRHAARRPGVRRRGDLGCARGDGRRSRSRPARGRSTSSRPAAT